MIINVENDEMLGRTNDKALHITLIEQQQEIERLKEEIKGYEQERERVLNIIDERNHKAIKYLKSKEWAIDYEKSSCRTHLLEILKGEDNDI